MEARQHDDSLFFDDVEERVRKLAQQRAADLFMYYRKGQRGSLHACQTGVGRTQELKP